MTIVPDVAREQVEPATPSDPVRDALDQARALARAGLSLAAIRHYDAILAIQPGASEAWFLKGLTELDVGDFAGAATSFAACIAVEPTHEWAHFQLGALAASCGRPRTALAHYTRAYALAPDFGELQINVGNMQLALGRMGAAAATLGPMGSGLVGWWASAREQALSGVARARREFGALLVQRRAARRTPDRARNLAIARALVTLGRSACALRWTGRMMRAMPRAFDAYAIHLDARVARDGIAAGVQFLEALDWMFDETAAYHRARAELYHEQGRTDLALDQHARAAAAGGAAPLGSQAMPLIAAGRWDGLLAIARDGMAHGDDVAPYVLALQACRGLGRVQFVDVAQPDSPTDPVAESAIPARIMQFWDRATPPDDVRATMATWPAANPDFDYRVFDAATARVFLAERYGAAVVRVYDGCHHPAMQSDVFRIAYLLAEGGFYIDADDACAQPLAPLRAALGTASFAASLSGNVTPYVYNAFLAGRPGAPILAAAFTEMIAMLEQLMVNGIRPDIWHCTGPGLVTRVVARSLIEATDDARFLTVAQYRRIAPEGAGLAYKAEAAHNWRLS